MKEISHKIENQLHDLNGKLVIIKSSDMLDNKKMQDTSGIHITQAEKVLSALFQI